MTETADDRWFYWRETRPGLWLIAEPGHVYTWLVVGSERACLVDTGTGFAPIRPVVAAITSLPVVVVNSHYHFDHVGGNAEFERILVHPDGADPAVRPPPAGILRSYLDYVRARDGELAAFRAVDAGYFGLLGVESDPRPLPDRVEERVLAATPYRGEVDLLTEGEKIDLGGRSLQVLYTPGHSPDGLSFLDEREGLLITGDAFNLGLVYCHFTDSDLAELQRTARVLAELSGHVGYVTTHHYPRVIAEPNLLVEYSQALESAATAPLEPTVDAFGQRCLSFTAGHFTITLPDPEYPAYV